MVPFKQICMEILVFLVEPILAVLIHYVRFANVHLKFARTYKVHESFVFGQFASIFTRIRARCQIRVMITRVLLLDVDHVWRGEDTFQFDHKHGDRLISQLLLRVLAPIQSQLLCDPILHQLIQNGIICH